MSNPRPPIKLDRQILAQMTPNHQALVALERVLEDVGGTLPDTIEIALSQSAQALAATNAALAQLVGALSDIEYLLTAATRTPPPFEEEFRPVAQFGTIAPQNAEAVDITGGTIGLDEGTAAVPSFYLVDRATGLYRIGADNWGLSVNATKLLDFKTALLQVVGRVRIDDGTVAAPSLYFGVNTGSGIYQIAANQIGVSISGAKVIDCAAAGVAVTGYLAATGQITSSVATGTIPILVNSTTLCPNLYVARAVLADNASHLSIGSVFPANAFDLPSVINLANALKAAAVGGGL